MDMPLRSVSQINSFTRCPMAYKLSRIDKVWSRPAAWLPQGSAFHLVAEAYEVWRTYGMPLSLEEARSMFREFYVQEIEYLTEVTPNFDYWSKSGPYHGMRDAERRMDVGLEQVDKFFAWQDKYGQEIWIDPDGTPAIELDFLVEFDGIMVRGFIDAVVIVDGELRVRDYKTGNTPGDVFQLAVYAQALGLKYGIDPPRTGDYYMAGKKGKPPSIVVANDLHQWTAEMVAEEFRVVEAMIEAEQFAPLPEISKCMFCDVSHACEFKAT